MIVGELFCIIITFMLYIMMIAGFVIIHIANERDNESLWELGLIMAVAGFYIGMIMSIWLFCVFFHIQDIIFGWWDTSL